MKKLFLIILCIFTLLSGCTGQNKPNGEVWETDVVVVGAGMAGLSAAISAKEAGANVILIEKQGMIGGSAGLASGAFAVTGSHFEKEQNVEDTVDAAVKRWMNWGNVWGVERKDSPNLFPNEEKVEFILSKTGENIDWMEAHGVKYKDSILVYTNNMTRLVANYPDYGTGGMGVATTLKENAEKLGVTVYTDTKGSKLVVEDGKVTGIIAEKDGKEVTIKANNVILTTGGFSHNEEMMKDLVPEFAGMKTTAASGTTGDGIKMALEVGAVLYEDAWVISANPSVSDAYLSVNKDASTLPYKTSPMVNANGERFINENSWYSALSNSMAIIDGQEYSIYDSSDATRVAILESGLESGEVIKAETLSELAGKLQMDSTKLESTIKDFNDKTDGLIPDPYPEKSTAQGLGSSEAKADDSHPRVKVGPFYAVKMYPVYMGTMGGVKTDNDAHVLNAQGEIIPGLYAAGEMSNRPFYHYTYMGAGSLSSYSIMGRIAGENAAKK